MMLMITSADKQVIITTHHPEILKYCELTDIFLISRNSKGFSDIERVCDNSAVMPFIEEVGVGSVFVNNFPDLK